MNWLCRSIKTAQQALSLNMESLKGLQGTPQAQTAASILRMFNSLFEAIPSLFVDQPLIAPLDSSEIGSEVYQAVRENDDIQFESFDEAWNFITNENITPSDLQHTLKLSIDLDGLGFVEGDINGPAINGMSTTNGTWPQDDGRFVDQVVARLQSLKDGLDNTKNDIAEFANSMIREEVWSRKDVRQFYDYYLQCKEHWELASRGAQNPNWLSNFNQLFDNLSKLAGSYLLLTSKGQHGPMTPVLPPLFDENTSFISPEKFLRRVKDAKITAATKYFLDHRPELSDALLADAKRIHEEQEKNEYLAEKREFDHQFGLVDQNTSWLDYFKQPFDPSQEGDPRLSLTAQRLSDMGARLARMGKVQGAAETGAVMTTYVVSIQMTGFQDQSMAAILGNSLEFAPDHNQAIQGIEVARNAGVHIPEILEQSANPTILIENHFAEMEDFFADLKRAIKQRTYEYTAEDAAKMRELGIARKVPSIDYAVKEKNYPGGGWVKNLPSNFPAFVIAFAPSPDLIVEKGIPRELLTRFNVHHLVGPGQGGGRQQEGVGTGVPPIGWVGGYIDPTEKSMYVFELQSDLMQATGQMRDPAKMEQERTARREQLTQEIAQLKQQIEEIRRQAVEPKPKKDPRAGLRAKLKRIDSDISQTEQELAQLSAQNTEFENQPGFDPQGDAAGQYRHNAQLIDTKLKKLQQFKAQKQKMEENLARIPAPATEQPEIEPGQPAAIDTQSQQKIDKMQGRIEQMEEEIVKTREPIHFDSRKPPIPEWHDYKNTIENTFADWIKIFWNTAVREAIRNNMNYLYIITANDLRHKIWPSFADAGTLQLFQRIYDGYGRDFYGGEEVTKHGYKFWRVDLRNPEIKVASGWLSRALSNMTKFGSLLPIAEPVLILGDTGIPLYAFPIPTDPATTAATV